MNKEWRPLGAGLHALDTPEGEWMLSVFDSWPVRISHPDVNDIAYAQSLEEAKLLVKRFRSDDAADPLAEQLETAGFTAGTTHEGNPVWRRQEMKSRYSTTTVIRTRTGVIVRYGGSANRHHEVAKLYRFAAPDLRADADNIVVAHALDMLERRRARGGYLTRPL